MSAPTLASLCLELVKPGKLTEETIGFAATALVRDGKGFVEALTAIAEGNVDMDDFLGAPPVMRQARQLRRYLAGEDHRLSDTAPRSRLLRTPGE